MRITIAILVSIGAMAAPAHAGSVLLHDDGTPMAGRWQQWVDQAHVPTPDVELRVSFTNPDGIETVAYVRQGTTTIYVVKPDLMSPRLLLHELGHVYDSLYLTDADRAAIMQQVLRRGGAWRQSPPNSPHEQFAEAYAVEATSRVYRPVTYGFSMRLSWPAFNLLHTWLTNIPRVRAMGF